LQGFEKYAIKSWCVENVVFWIDVRAFKTDVARKDISPADKLKHAKRIYMTYVVDSADLMVAKIVLFLVFDFILFSFRSTSTKRRAPKSPQRSKRL